MIRPRILFKKSILQIWPIFILYEYVMWDEQFGMGRFGAYFVLLILV
jgi:hypothetical protein